MLKKLWDIFVEASEFARVYTYWKKAQERMKEQKHIELGYTTEATPEPSDYVVILDGGDADKPN